MASQLVRLRIRRSTGAEWISANPILGNGELAWESDTDIGKIGDGATVYLSLPYTLGGVTRTPINMTGAVPGEILIVDVDGTSLIPAVLDLNPTAPPSVLDDLTDVAITTPADGTCLIYSATVGGWINSPQFIANLVLPTGAAVPAGTPPCIVWDLPVTILKSHTMEGTSGATVTATLESATAYTGATTTYTNTQHAVGSTCIQVASGNTGYLSDTGLALATAVLGMWVRFPATPSGSVNFAEMRTSSASLGALQRDVTGVVKVKNGSGTTTATSTTALAVDTWFRFEWMLGSSSQTFRLYDAANTKLEEITGAATSGVVDTIRMGVVTNLNGALFMDYAKIAASWIGS